VQIFGRLPGQLGPVSLGEAPAGPDGVWSVTAPSLAQGIYAMSSMVISPSGVVGPMTAFTASGGFVTVDYTPPQVVSLTYNRNTGQLTAIFADNLSGMDVASMVNPLNYTLIFGPVSRRGPSTVTPIPTVASIPTDPEGVVVSFAINSRLRSALKAVRLISGGVRDLAGNTLAAEELVPVNAKPARRPRRR
jgi:hypothetical protein